MTALTQARNTPSLFGDRLEPPVAAAATIHQGSLVCLDASGNAVPGSTATGLKAIGRAGEAADNSAGAAGDTRVLVEPGVFRWANSAGADAIDRGLIGRVCWIVDDQTVAATPAGGTRSPAGTVWDVDALGVWVRSGPAETAAAGGTVHLTLAVPSLVGADAGVVRLPSPVAGTVTAVRTVLNGALATGDATLTAKIGATAITGGVVTIAQSGSAAGVTDAALPTAARTVAAGDALSLTVGGANTASVSATAIIEITV